MDEQHTSPEQENVQTQAVQQTIPDDLSAQLTTVTKQRDEYLDGWKRAKADYINYKNEQEKRGKELAQFASYAILLQLVPIMQHFRKAFACVSDDLKNNEWVKGIEQISRQLRDVLKTLGAEEAESALGKPFDPTLHESVGQEQRDDVTDGSVSQEIESGWTLHGKPMIPAKVIINKIPESGITDKESDDMENNP